MRLKQGGNRCRLIISVSLCLILFLQAGATWSAGIKVVYPAYQDAGDRRFEDLIEILHTALEKTVPEFGPYELQPSKLRMNGNRYQVELKSGQDVNIIWSSTSIKKEKEMLPLRIPLRKGLLGYRIALIAKDSQAKIDRVRTIDDLRKFTIGQGVGWGDVDVFEANGFTVHKAQYGSLFKMVDIGRFDLFPRGVGEIFNEFAIRSEENPNLAIEQQLLIYYPWPYYFFFNNKDVALHHRIERGVRMMIDDGSFDALFRKHNDKAIKRANLKHRRLIVLHNDLLPPETPLGDASLWFDPANY